MLAGWSAFEAGFDEPVPSGGFMARRAFPSAPSRLPRSRFPLWLS